MSINLALRSTFQYAQKDDWEVKLTFFVPGLKPEKKSYRQKRRKERDVCLTYYKQGLSLEMTAEVKEKDPETKKEVVRKYKKVIRRFPSAVDINRCEYEVMTGKVEAVLRKKEDIDWKPFTDRRGLDQLDSREPSPDEDTIEGAAAAAEPRPQPITLEELVYGNLLATHEVDIPDPERPGERQITQVTAVFNRLEPRERPAERREQHENGPRIMTKLMSLSLDKTDDDDDNEI